MKISMKLYEAQEISGRLETIEIHPIEELYSLRNKLPEFFQAGFCTVGVYKFYDDRIKAAIFKRLSDARQYS